MCVPPRGLEPLQSRIKSPVPGQSGASGIGKSAPVESNHALPAYQAGPVTGWVEAVMRKVLESNQRTALTVTSV